MNAKKVLLIVGIIAIVLAVITGVVIKNLISGPTPTSAGLSLMQQQTGSTTPQEPLDPAIKVTATWSKTKDNTVVLTVSGMGSKVSTLAYEFSYESRGLIKGVNSGSNPISVTGQDVFNREVYLGTCSRNDCRPDLGVSKVSVVIEFHNADGKQSQYSGDFILSPGTSAPSTTVIPHQVTD